MSDVGTTKEGQESAVKPVKSRHRWTEGEDIRLLRQYRTTVETFEGKESDLWQDIYCELLSVGIKLSSVRSGRDRCGDLIKSYKTKSRLGYWKSGDLGTFTEKETLLCEILEYLDDQAKRPKPSKKTAEQNQQARTNKRFIVAASSSRKKRGVPGKEGNSQDDSEDDVDLVEEDSDVSFTPPKRGRINYNDAIKAVLEVYKQIKSKELKLQQDKLDLERAREARLAEESKMRIDLDKKRIEADKARMDNDRKREETFTTFMLEVLKTLKR